MCKNKKELTGKQVRSQKVVKANVWNFWKKQEKNNISGI